MRAVERHRQLLTETVEVQKLHQTRMWHNLQWDRKG